MRASVGAYRDVPISPARRINASCVFGKNFSRFPRNVDTRQKNIPAFQKYFPEETYFRARPSAGFSVKQRTEKTGTPPASSAFPRARSMYPNPVSGREGGMPSTTSDPPARAT